MAKVTAPKIVEMKGKEPITMLTAYDYPTAKFVDESGIEIVLVGDSLSNVILGYENTIPVTMDEMLHHTKAVSRGVKNALVVGDMPFMSYQASTADAVRNAGRFVKEGKAEAVKLEGGIEQLDKIKAIIDAGIPVMTHLGLTPQSIHKFGGYKVQGRDKKTERNILQSAKALAKAGSFCLVLECVPAALAKRVTQSISIPTIGIGAGPHCDGQVLVFHDLVGLVPGNFNPKFVKRYANIGEEIKKAVGNFRREVKQKKFPTKEHSFD